MENKKEIWLDIPNYEGYQVSDLGRVRTYRKTSYTERHGVRHWKDRILKFKGETYQTGYRVDLWKDGKSKTFLVARLVAYTFYEKDINDQNTTVNHIDGNRFNNNLENLEIISLADNIRHAFNTGLMPYKKVKVIRKSDNQEFIFRSMVKASEFIGMNKSYVCCQIKRNIYENKDYSWCFA